MSTHWARAAHRAAVEKFKDVYEYHITFMLRGCRVGEAWRKPGEEEVREGSAMLGPGFEWPDRGEIDRLARKLARKPLDRSKRFSGRGGRLNVTPLDEDDAREGPEFIPPP